MIKALKEWLDIWPTTSKALDMSDRCVKTGCHVYVVKDSTGQVEAIKCEIIDMFDEEVEGALIDKYTTSILKRLEEDNTPFPKNLFFGTEGNVHVVPLNYNINIADMADM